MIASSNEKEMPMVKFLNLVPLKIKYEETIKSIYNLFINLLFKRG